MTTPGTRSRLGVQWSLILVTIVGIAYAGIRMLAVPPILHPADLMSWWTSAGPTVGAMSILWAAVVAAGVYCLLLYGAVAVAGASGTTAWLAKSRLPGTNHLLRSFAGASVLGVTLVAASGCGTAVSAAHSGSSHRSPPLLVPVGAVPNKAATTTPAEPQSEPTTAETTPAETTPAETTPAETGPAEASLPPPPEHTSAITEWTVRAGDDLWSIAESVLAGRLGHPPTDNEIAPLWLRVIEANRATLPDPGNPSLLFAGDVVAVPW